MTFRLLRQPELLLPHLEVQDITNLNWAALHKTGARGLVFDKDNTLTLPYALHLEPKLELPLQNARAVFGPERLAIISNSAGTPDDHGGVEADAIEQALAIRVLRRQHKKPRGFESIEHQFPSCPPATLVMIGDRLLTDVVFGNAHGMLTVYCKKLTGQGEPLVVRVARRVETWLARFFRSRGARPPSHPLLTKGVASGVALTTGHSDASR